MPLTVSIVYVMKFTPEVKPARPVLHHQLGLLRLGQIKRNGAEKVCRQKVTICLNDLEIALLIVVSTVLQINKS